jgi:hypothetical protein
VKTNFYKLSSVPYTCKEKKKKRKKERKRKEKKKIPTPLTPALGRQRLVDL